MKHFPDDGSDEPAAPSLGEPGGFLDQDEDGSGQRDHHLFMLWSLLHQTYTLVHKNQDRALAEYGLNMSRYLALFIVHYATRTVNPTAIAAYLSQETPSVTYALDRLEERGLLRRRPAPHHRREIVLELTDEGRELLDRANAAAWLPLLQISEVFDVEHDFERLFGTLVKLRDRAAVLCGANIDALNMALEHRRRDPFMYGSSGAVPIE